MEIERAIEILRVRLEFVADINIDAITAYKMGVKALEKQIPKKINIYDYGKAYCPKCKTDVHGIGKISYCFKCGQKLDWYR